MDFSDEMFFRNNQMKYPEIISGVAGSMNTRIANGIIAMEIRNAKAGRSCLFRIRKNNSRIISKENIEMTVYKAIGEGMPDAMKGAMSKGNRGDQYPLTASLKCPWANFSAIEQYEILSVYK